MKKISLLLILINLILAIYYTTSAYLEISKNEKKYYLEIEETFLSEASNLSKTLSSYETTSTKLSTNIDLNALNTNLYPNISSIVILDPEKKFSSGWKLDADGHKYKITEIPIPIITKNFGWIDIQLNTSLRTSKAVYIIPTLSQNFLLITYDLSTNLNSLRSLSYGFNTFAHVENKKNQITPPSHPFTSLDRIRNAEIYLESPLLRKWSLIFSGTWSDIYPYPVHIIHSFFISIVLWGLCIISFTALILKGDRFKTRTLWIISLLFNIYCCSIIIFLFIDLPAISKQTSLRTAAFRKTQEFFKVDPSVILIPTAVYVDSLSFPNDTSFLVTGFISQIYPKDNLMNMGFLFPYQSTLYSSTIKEISRFETETTITILWYFGVGLTAPFSTKFFPFDKRVAQITLWPTELHKNIVFFPNYLNFSTLSVLEKPGFDALNNPNGWTVLESNFILKNESPYKFFFPAETDAPLTYIFAITLAREFLGAFLSNILVLVLCIFVAFLVLFIPRDSLLDSLFATISIFVGLIFIAVTNHSSLRETLEVSSFAYCEYLFISFYILILAITIDFILRRSKEATSFERNYILAIFYWPALLGSFTIMLSLSILT